MTLTTPYSATFIVGDGETKTFSYLFEEVSPNFISVMVYNSVTGLISTPTYIIDTDQKQVIFGEDTPAPTADETVCIYRNTPNVQDVAFRTLHGYDAQTLENILSKIVAMIQEIKSNYFSTQVLQGDPWQLDLLSSADDGATVNIDYTAKKLVKGLYFKITSGNLQVSADGVTYLALPKSDDVAEFRQYEQTLPDLTVIRKLQYRVGNQWFDAEANAQYTADSAYSLAESVQTTVNAHINNTQNPHQTSMANLTDTDLAGAESGQFLQFNGVKWKAVYSSASVSWGGILGDIDDQTDLQDKFYTKFDKTGGAVLGEIDIRRNSSTSSALLTMTNNTANTARIWRFAPSYSTVSLSVYPGSTETNGYRFVSTGFCPASNNARYLGAASLKWKGVYTGALNNGADLVVPNKAGTLATMDDVELAARSGTQLTDQGVWYAKMYAATVAPAAEDGTNYADFSQVDGQGNPIIVTYNRVNGAWVQDQTITPPAEYDGYVLVTSKIWDIAEQTGQQGGRVLWNHTSKEFTPYPQIISFEDIGITGDSTVIMPQNPGANQIVNKDYVDEAIASIPTPTEVIDAEVIGALTINGSEVSGFGYRKNLVLPGIFSLDAIEINSFEIGGSFTTPADFNSVAPYIIQGIKANTTSITGGILIRISSTDMVATIAPDGAPAVSMLGPTTLNTSTEYWFKLLWDGTTQTYSLLLSADGETFATIATKTDSVRPADATYTIGIGDGYTYIAAVDMEDWYIKKNGQIVWQGMNVPGLATKANVDLSNVLNNIDFVVESQLPTAQNNYTWYRKYKSGWVEQGGTLQTAANSLTFPIEMADTNYQWYANPVPQDFGNFRKLAATRTTTGLTGLNNMYGTSVAHTSAAVWDAGTFWEVKGMAQG